MTKKKELGPGRKECPKCKAIVGARSGNCECGYVFVPKSGGKLTKRADNLQACIPIIKGMGGSKGLIKALKEYEAVAGPIDRLGGVKQAQAILDQLEALKQL